MPISRQVRKLWWLPPSPNPQLFAPALNKWFLQFQRDLPWRHREHCTNPYSVLVSEIMLQQTTVAAVVPYFLRFLHRFPEVQSLAAAPEQEVLAHWAGLGYYARARNLQKAAQHVVREYGGAFPSSVPLLLQLPGVGRYTAGAVASIAFNQRAPIVDANVTRVLARMLCLQGDIKNTTAQQKLWHAAQEVVEVPNVEPRTINPALMELGATLCAPQKPQCGICPVQTWCGAFRMGLQNQIPPPKVRREPTQVRHVCAAARKLDAEGKTHYLLTQRPDAVGTWWRGMWELPRTEIGPGETAETALARLGIELGQSWTVGPTLHLMKHAVTRYAVELECRELSIHDHSGQLLPMQRWYDLEAALQLALPSSMKKLLLALHRGNTSQLELL